jgi:hypothetical protein
MKAESQTGETAHAHAVIIAGVSSGAGKTSVAEAITGMLAKEFHTAAAKITVTHGERGCPHGGKGCNVCTSLGGDFQIVTRDSIIQQAGTDTARLLAAGGKPVVWAITRDVAIKTAWQEMAKLFVAADYVVIESNTLAQTIKPAATLMIVDPTVSRKIWKPSAEHLIATANHIIFNDRGTAERRATLLSEIERLRGNIDDLIYVSHPHEIAAHTVLRRSLADVYAGGKSSSINK